MRREEPNCHPQVPSEPMRVTSIEEAPWCDDMPYIVTAAYLRTGEAVLCGVRKGIWVGYLKKSFFLSAANRAISNADAKI